MTVSAVSHNRGGTIDDVAPVATRLKAARLKCGVAYRPCRLHTGPNVGDWFVVVQHADQTACEDVQAAIARDPECQQPSPRLQSSRRGLTENCSPISIFDTAGFGALARLHPTSVELVRARVRTHCWCASSRSRECRLQGDGSALPFGSNGSQAPVHRQPDRSFAAERRSNVAEHPLLGVKRTHDGPNAECPVTTAAAAVQAVANRHHCPPARSSIPTIAA